jgi:hypothetical protein
VKIDRQERNRADGPARRRAWPFAAGRPALLLGAALLGLLLPAPARAGAETVTFDAMLIHASDDQTPMDRRLEKVEYQLRRMFKFQYYKHYGEGSAAVTLPGETTIDFGHGFSLKINATAKDGKIRAEVVWKKADGTVLLSTTVVAKRGQQLILGGVPHERGTLIVTLVPR